METGETQTKTLNIEIRDLRRKDYHRAIQYAIRGMHFDWYLDQELPLKLYGTYFWYMEMNRATHIFAAYADGRFAGVLLAAMKGETPKRRSRAGAVYVKIFDFVQKTFYKDGAGAYEKTIKEQLEHYRKSVEPDGEIVFLAADPDLKIRGAGSALLRAFEQTQPGKTVYLHTDNACTYQFYEHRGFQRMEEKEIVLDVPKGKVPLKCFLYSKKIPEGERGEMP